LSGVYIRPIDGLDLLKRDRLGRSPPDLLTTFQTRDFLAQFADHQFQDGNVLKLFDQQRLKLCTVQVLTCRSCLHQQDADLPALGAPGRGDVPLVWLRWPCAQCGHGTIDMVVTSKPMPPP
jgi:hypothetical protein